MTTIGYRSRRAGCHGDSSGRQQRTGFRGLPLQSSSPEQIPDASGKFYAGGGYQCGQLVAGHTTNGLRKTQRIHGHAQVSARCLSWKILLISSEYNHN